MRLPRIASLFPLLRKELTETATRRRTYVWRVLCVCALYGATGYLFATEVSRHLSRNGSVLALLGKGRDLFHLSVIALTCAVALFQPALAAGSFTREKERGTMTALLLTDIRPFEMLIEKYVASLIPMLSLLLLTAPLLAFCHMLGGVTNAELYGVVWLLFLASAQIAAVATMMSAFCTTTVGAFVTTYVVSILLYTMQGVFVGILTIGWSVAGVSPGSGNWEAILVAAACPFVLLMNHRELTLGLGELALVAVPALLSLLVPLAFGRVFVTSRAFVVSRNRIKELWAGVDEFVNWVNSEYAGGIVLVKDDRPFPELKPVAWRELSRGGQNSLRYLVRIAICMELPVLVCGSAVVALTVDDGVRVLLMVIAVLLWILATMTVVVKCVNAIAAERVRGSLEALLTTPMRGAEILSQKLQGARIFLWLVLVPFVTLALLKIAVIAKPFRKFADSLLWGSDALPAFLFDSSLCQRLSYLALSSLCVLLYLGTFGWIGLWAGLVIRNRLRAMLSALGIIVAWNVLPLAAFALEGTSWVRQWALVRWFVAALITLAHATCPLFNLIIVESGEHPMGWDTLGVMTMILNVGVSYFILWQLREYCMRNADRLLGRVPEPR
ncbi:MAG: hypothetical protein KAI66_07160 [Lentisphaeria bacterium]|nr:hypothetical protein [Lentisphaeria bacterium]